MRSCKKCGFDANRDTASFCASCGESLGSDALPPDDTATLGNHVQFTGDTVRTDSHIPPPVITTPLTSRALLSAGDVLQNRYRIVRVLGKGGMGAVYLVEDMRLYGKQWALKELLERFIDPVDREEAIEQFRGEVQILVGLRHPHLPEVVNTFEAAGRHYLVMEFIEGQTLEKLLETAPDGHLPEEQVLAWAAQICDVLDYLHSHDPPVIFRDLKPANVMITPQGQVKLIDFGVARLFDPDKGTDTLRMGTVGYAPPEQYSGQGQTTPRSDIYALGATLYDLLTDDSPEAHPFVFTPLRQLNRKISARTARVVDKAVQLDPGDRFSCARTLKAALLEQERRRSLPALLIGLPLLAMLLAGGAWLLWQNGPWSRSEATPTSPSDAVAQITPSPTATRRPTSTPAPTSTPIPDLTATAIAACVFDFEIVTDSPVWPSVLMPGQQFVKQWEIKNSGTCAWPEGVELAFESGDELDVVEAPMVEPLAPEGSTEIEIALRAPTNFNNYTSVWQLQDGAGNPIGEGLEIACRVGATPTPRATSTPLPTPTPEFTIGPLGFSMPSIVEWDKNVEGQWWGWAAFDVWGGDGNYRYYMNGIREDLEFFEPRFFIEGQKCKPWVGTVIVVSGDGREERREFMLPYPEQDRCD
ncbi:MAG: protein kinase [Chloroflexi bacterium]|nr:protein kinase [Chloroflexota bacterium]